MIFAIMNPGGGTEDDTASELPDSASSVQEDSVMSGGGPNSYAVVFRCGSICCVRFEANSDLRNIGWEASPPWWRSFLLSDWRGTCAKCKASLFLDILDIS